MAVNSKDNNLKQKGKCVGCGVYIYADDPYSDGYCKLCRCWVCKKVVSGLYNDSMAEPFVVLNRPSLRNICKPCLKVKYKDILCKGCGNTIADVCVREKGVPRKDEPQLCWTCAKIRVNNSAITALCWFCDSPALDSKGKMWAISPYKFPAKRKVQYIVCSVCSGSPSCLKNGCKPTKPCHKCLSSLEIEVNDQIMHANSANEVSGLNFYFKQPLQFHRADMIRDRRTNRSMRTISAEIESTGLRLSWDLKHGEKTQFKQCICLRCYKERLIKIANLVHDIGGSIVPDESVGHLGFEINMPPASGDFFLQLTDRVSDLLYESLAMVSNKAGTHLHVDASDYSWQDMRKFLILYSKIEPAILYTQPRDRVMKNPKPHCRPCGERYKKLAETTSDANWKPKMVEAIYTNEFPRPPRLFRGNNRTITARYDFVNIQSWFFRGTIEIRGHSGTIDSYKIKNWGMIWASILDAAARMTEKEITQLPDDSPKEILLSITPSRTHPYLFNRWEVFEAEYKKKGKMK